VKKVVWVSSWKRVCGIADYSEELFAALRKEARDQFRLEIVTVNEGEHFKSRKEIVAEILLHGPDLIHFHHEYSFFGGKNPPKYWFPKLIRNLRAKLPQARILATAHTVVGGNYRFPVKGRGTQIPARWLANQLVLPWLRTYWGRKTWGGLDGVIVHSGTLVETVKQAGCPKVLEIPLFVPLGSAPAHTHGRKRTVLVFGFLTPEKGQDIVIRALVSLPLDVKLILAGSVRRQQDRGYEQNLRQIIREHGLESRVEITGFVLPEKVEEYYRQAELVVVPLRESSGSASLTQAFSRGAAILASDLPLNKEIATRVPGVLELFRSEDAGDCARKIEALLNSPEGRRKLSLKADEYAARYSPEKVARMHLDFYREYL
jgi:glycosyltransferase involved in cell wall biosynthesis